MKENVRWVRTQDVTPLHAVEDFAHYQRLVNSLANGWTGEPLLGVEIDGRVHLLTGSHRYAAAATLVIAVPVYVMALSKAQAAQALEKFQDDRAKIIRASGDKEAIRIFMKEMKDGR